MTEAVIAAVIVSTLLATATLAHLRTGRMRLYRELGERQEVIAKGGATEIALPATTGLPDFGKRLASIDTALQPDQFQRLVEDVETLVATERSYLPTHKKGGTVAYETLCSSAPGVVAIYLSPQMIKLVSEVVGETVQPTPLHDQSSCSVLFYERPGDHIGWHYDHNFYKGRHFTVLIPVVNRNADGSGLSAATLMGKVAGKEVTIPTPPNSMVVFEGARIVHKVTPIAEGERRVVLSMTYCTDPRSSLLQGTARRIKDIAFFGIRALWT